MQADFVQPEIVLGVHRDGDFFDWIHFGVAARPVDLNRWRRILARLDEEVLAEADVLAAIDSGDVIQAVFVESHAGVDPVPFPSFQFDLAIVTQHEKALIQRTVG